MIRAIIFDVGGVLVGGGDKTNKDSVHSGVHDAMAHYFGISLDDWFDAIDTIYTKSIEGKISGEKAVNIIAKNLKTNPDKLRKIWIKEYKKHLRKNNHLYKIAYFLKKKGYRIGILSDQWYLSKKALMTRENVKEFNPVIISCDAGMRKPNPRLYKFLIKKIRLKPEEILFIDNRDWNLKPAVEIGIRTILFKNNRKLVKELKKMKVI